MGAVDGRRDAERGGRCNEEVAENEGVPAHVEDCPISRPEDPDSQERWCHCEQVHDQRRRPCTKCEAPERTKLLSTWEVAGEAICEAKLHPEDPDCDHSGDRCRDGKTDVQCDRST